MSQIYVPSSGGSSSSEWALLSDQTISGTPTTVTITGITGYNEIKIDFVNVVLSAMSQMFLAISVDAGVTKIPCNSNAITFNAAGVSSFNTSPFTLSGSVSANLLGPNGLYAVVLIDNTDISFLRRGNSIFQSSSTTTANRAATANFESNVECGQLNWLQFSITGPNTFNSGNVKTYGR